MAGVCLEACYDSDSDSHSFLLGEPKEASTQGCTFVGLMMTGLLSSLLVRLLHQHDFITVQERVKVDFREREREREGERKRERAQEGRKDREEVKRHEV